MRLALITHALHAAAQASVMDAQGVHSLLEFCLPANIMQGVH